jgi:NADH-quinone oxidoreductase subunit F
MAHILLRHRDIENIHQLDVYREHGGYSAFEKCLKEMRPGQVIDIIRKANIAGRGGAGFPAGIKWSFIPKDAPTKYVVINTDESETGTFKDRELCERNPHQVIEGALIAAYAVGAEVIYNYFRGEYMDAACAFEEAIQEAYAAGLLGENILGTDYGCALYTHYGAGAYICGEETALLASMAGELGQPWSKPPFPAQAGLYGMPTVVNNVETLANVPPVIANGADWYLSLGSESSPGPKIVCLSGHVKRPGNYEIIMGKTTYRELIYGAKYGQGIPGNKAVKAMFPSGGSGPMATAAALDAPISFDGLAPFDSMMGTASLIIMDDDTDMVWAARKAIEFFCHESCGKCTPCRVGLIQIRELLEKIMGGYGAPEDLEQLEDLCNVVKSTSLCGLGQTAPNPVLGTLKYFRDEYEALVPESVSATLVEV